MKNNKLILILSVGILFGPAFAMAQGNIPGQPDSLEMIGNRGAEEIPEADKPNMDPDEIKVQVETENIDFEVRGEAVQTEYIPADPNVRKPGKDVWPSLYNNFVKASFGRFATPVGRLYLHNGRDDNLDLGLDLNHISASNGHEEFAEFRENFGTLTAKYHMDRHTVGAKAYVFNNNYFFYADSILGTNPEKKDSIRQTFTKLRFDVDLLKNYSPDDIHYGLGLQFRDYFDRYGNNELHVTAKGNLNWKITDEFAAGLDGNLTFSNARFDSITQSRTFLDFTPHVTFATGKLRAKAGLKLNSYTDSTNIFNAAPILEGAYDLIENRLTVQAAMQGEMRYNTWYDLVETNKWLAGTGDIRPTSEKVHFRGGVSGGLSKYITFSLFGYWRRMNRMPVFYNPEGGSRFLVVYDSLTKETGLEATVQVNVDDKVRGGVQGTFRRFDMKNISHNYGVPNTRFDFWTSAKLAEKVWITTEVYLFGKRTMTLDTAGNTITENAMADVNLQVDYSFSKRISIFIELNNILSNRYFRWYNYRERPFDVKAGATLSF